MRTRDLALLGLFALALVPTSSHAYNCTSHTYGQAPYLCAYTYSHATPNGTEATENGLEYFDQIGGPADDKSAGDGGVAGSAFIDVDWGLISGACDSDNGDFTTFDPNEGRDSSHAEGAFADIATLVSDTLPPGTPVTLSVRFDAAESDAGAGSVDLSYDLANFHNQTPTLVHNEVLLSGGNHTLPAAVPLGGYSVGDSLIFRLLVVISSSTTNQVNPPRLVSAAHLAYARLAFDIDTPGVALVSETSGTDYTTVPEASQVLLLGVGALVFAALGRGSRVH